MNFVDQAGKTITPGCKVVIAVDCHNGPVLRHGVVYRVTGWIDGLGNLAGGNVGVRVRIEDAKWREGYRYDNRSYSKLKNMLIIG